MTEFWEGSEDVAESNNIGGIFCKETKRQQPKSVKKVFLKNKNRLHLLILHLKRLRVSQLQYCLTKALLFGSQRTLEKEGICYNWAARRQAFISTKGPVSKATKIHNFSKNSRILLTEPHEENSTFYNGHLLFYPFFS